MPNTRNQWVAYLAALSTDKTELHIKDMKSVVRGGQKNCKYWNLHPVVMSDCSLIATQKSHAKHKKSVRRIPRGAEHRQNRVAHQRHEMDSERRQKKIKYWNLHPVVMSDCSLIAPRNSHAKHNKSVVRIPRGAEVCKSDMG